MFHFIVLIAAGATRQGTCSDRRREEGRSVQTHPSSMGRREVCRQEREEGKGGRRRWNWKGQVIVDSSITLACCFSYKLLSYDATTYKSESNL